MIETSAVRPTGLEAWIPGMVKTQAISPTGLEAPAGDLCSVAVDCQVSCVSVSGKRRRSDAMLVCASA